MQEYLRATDFIDSEDPLVMDFAHTNTNPDDDDVDKAIKLYYAVRDQIRYDPYLFSLKADTYRASDVLHEGAAFCVPKAILMCAAARALHIPAAVGFADVRNHLNTEKLQRLMGTDVFIYHGYTALYLNENWVKATPAFNIELCQRFGVAALEFDGKNHAMLHEFDGSNRRHMEYLRDHGWFAEFPFDTVAAAFRETYPQFSQLNQDKEDEQKFEDEMPLL